MVIQQPYAIISPAIAGDATSSTWFEYQLTKLGISFRKVDGKYNGVTEPSYIVLVEDDAQERAIYRLAKAFKQESVLFVDANGYAALFDSDGQWIRDVGRFVEVSEQEAANEPAYTHVAGKFYVAR